MPAYRGRNRRAQDAVVQQTPRGSRHGEPGVVKDVPPLRECERGADSWNGGREPRAGKQGSPVSERGNQPEQFRHSFRPTPRWARSGGGGSWTGDLGFTPGSSRERPQAERPVTSPGPSTRAWRGNWTWISDGRGPRAWKQGSLDPDHGDQSEKHDHALRPTPG